MMATIHILSRLLCICVQGDPTRIPGQGPRSVTLYKPGYLSITKDCSLAVPPVCCVCLKKLFEGTFKPP